MKKFQRICSTLVMLRVEICFEWCSDLFSLKYVVSLCDANLDLRYLG